MPSLTLAIPDELRKKMAQHPEINWSEVARQAIQRRLEDMDIFARFQKDSTLTEEDAIRIGRKIKKAMWERRQRRLLSASSSMRTSSSPRSSNKA